MVVSRYALDCMPYNVLSTTTTWKVWTLHNWLNNDFVGKAFEEIEKNRICETIVSANKNPVYDTDPGIDSKDKVFLLSVSEVNIYFSSDSERQCEPTENAKAKGAFTNDNGCCNWWLRTPGSSKTCAVTVGIGGVVNSGGSQVGNAVCAVRPAMWISLE